MRRPSLGPQVGQGDDSGCDGAAGSWGWLLALVITSLLGDGLLRSGARMVRRVPLRGLGSLRGRWGGVARWKPRCATIARPGLDGGLRWSSGEWAIPKRKRHWWWDCWLTGTRACGPPVPRRWLLSPSAVRYLPSGAAAKDESGLVRKQALAAIGRLSPTKRPGGGKRLTVVIGRAGSKAKSGTLPDIPRSCAMPSSKRCEAPPSSTSSKTRVRGRHCFGLSRWTAASSSCPA